MVKLSKVVKDARVPKFSEPPAQPLQCLRSFGRLPEQVPHVPYVFPPSRVSVVRSPVS